jgi:hypothetical protein
MSRLDKYRAALLAVFPDVTFETLSETLDAGGPGFASFVISHGLGPLWHERTGHEEFRESRLAAEALFLAQQDALADIDAVLCEAEIEYIVIKGAANRLLLNSNPAIRACFDIDLLVASRHRGQTTKLLMGAGFTATPESRSISRELVLSRAVVDVDLHWGLLREGRLRTDLTDDFLGRRRRLNDLWMASPEDTLFLLLVHPAFAKHLAGWTLGLHRVADIITWLSTQSFDWGTVRECLEQNGVRSAAWATLRWVQLLSMHHATARLDELVLDICPPRLRRNWLDYWLRNDLSSQMSNANWFRLIGFLPFLHDNSKDVLRALVGRLRARRRSEADLAAFRDLTGD